MKIEVDKELLKKLITSIVEEGHVKTAWIAVRMNLATVSSYEQDFCMSNDEVTGFTDLEINEKAFK